jgi:hypothetical protein
MMATNRRNYKRTAGKTEAKIRQAGAWMQIELASAGGRTGGETAKCEVRKQE